MNLEVILDTLEDNGVGTAGVDLFINFIPQDVTGILVRDYFGGTKIDHELPGYFGTRFMLISRAKDYESAMALVKGATASLTIKRQQTVRGVLFNYMRPMGLPFAYAPTAGQSIEVAVNMECCYVDSEQAAM